MKINQEELKKAYEAGKRVVLAYRKSFGIHWSHGSKSFVLRLYTQTKSGLPYTKRGRYCILEQAEAEKVIYS